MKQYNNCKIIKDYYWQKAKEEMAEEKTQVKRGKALDRTIAEILFIHNIYILFTAVYTCNRTCI